MNELLDELKDYLRIDGDEENSSLSLFFQSAISFIMKLHLTDGVVLEGSPEEIIKYINLKNNIGKTIVGGIISTTQLQSTDHDRIRAETFKVKAANIELTGDINISVSSNATSTGQIASTVSQATI